MPGMSTVSTGSPRPTRCHGYCGGSGAFGAFGALFFLDFDFLRSLDIVLSRSYRAVPELSRCPGVIVRSRSYRAVASRVSAGDALHYSLLTASCRGSRGRSDGAAISAGPMESRNVSQAAKVYESCVCGRCCLLASVLQAASSRFLLARAPVYCSHNSRATALWHRIDRTSPARTAPHAAKAAVHRCTARTAARRARRALQR